MDFLASFVEEQLLQEEGPEVLSCISSPCLAAVPRFLLASYSYYFCEDTGCDTSALRSMTSTANVVSRAVGGLRGGGRPDENALLPRRRPSE
jgi:hypothetical protein